MTDWNSAEDHVDRALELFKRGRLHEAEQALRQALDIAPDRGDWHFNLALTLEASGRLPEAVESYLAAVDALPEECEILATTGVALSKVNRMEEALAMLTRACELDPTCEEAWGHRINVLGALERHEDAESAYFLAQQYLDDYPNCLYAIGENLFARGELERAGWCFREAANQEPSLPRVRARLGAVFAAQGKTHRAVRMYLEDLREDPGCAQTLLEFGDLLNTIGRFAEAEEKYRRVLELQPADVEAHLRLGLLSLRLGKHAEALSELQLVRRLDPEHDVVVLHLADALLAMKRTQEAKRLLIDHVETIEPEKIEAERTTRICDLLLRAGLPGLTIDMLTPVIESRPDDLDLLRRLAFACFDSGDRPRGDRISRKLVKLSPTLESAHENLIISALQSNRYSLARLRLRRALSACPESERLRRLRVLLVLQWIPWFARQSRQLRSGS